MPISWDMYRHIKQTGFLPMGGTEFINLKGKAGVQRYNFSPGYGQRVRGEIVVTLDGVKMVENHDYTVDYHAQEIVFNKDVQCIYGGEEIVIHLIAEDAKHLMLLQRKVGNFEFSDEQLSDFLHDSINGAFDVDQLVRNFPAFNAEKLSMLEGRKIRVKDAKVVPEGIVATKWVVEA